MTPSDHPRPAPAVAKPDFNVVALATSAGGLRALSQILGGLPAGFPAAILVLQHLARHQPSVLPNILGRRTGLHVKEAAEGDRLEPGTVFVAPPDHHLLVNSDATLSLSTAELVHFVRPSADLLFESAAGAFKNRLVAVVLTGSGSDGSLGLHAVKKMGGCIIVEDEATAEFSGMPHAAILTGYADRILPLAGIAAALVALVDGSA
jgi:two-component system, chemotaxis family, protein-glutamate methylesterase/glutaminase